MKISKTDKYRALELKPEQYGQISSEEKIHTAMEDDSCMGFDAFKDEKRIGFALLREYEQGCFFLWDFIIHRGYQHRGNGYAFLRLLLEHIKKMYGAKIITTTYIAGNKAAKKLYESLGFEQTGVYKNRDIHEVNMRRDL